MAVAADPVRGRGRATGPLRSSPGKFFEGDTRAFDRAILLALRSPSDLSAPIGPRWMQETMRDFTALGGVAVLTIMTLAVAAYLTLIRKGRAALGMLIAVAGGMLLSSLLKYGFERPRPEFIPHGAYVYTSSFPSGHSTMSAVVYLTLGAFVARLPARVADQDLCDLARSIPDPAGWCEPHLSRRALADRRARRLDAGRGLGAAAGPWCCGCSATAV